MQIPSQALGAAIGVLIYSLLCFILCASLVAFLITYGEKWTYVTIHSCFTALSTLASIVQQFHYVTDWQRVQEAKYEKALDAARDPGLTFVGGAHQLDTVLFFIQFWCYNVMALNILFWSIALFLGAWNLRTPWMGSWLPRAGLISKAFSIIFPSFIVGLMQVRAILRSGTVTFIVANITMFISLTTTGFLLVLILYKYIKTRRLAAGGSRQGRWWASANSKSQQTQDVGSQYTRPTAQMSTRSSIYDRALIVRFSIAFVIMALFLVAIIIFSYVSSSANQNIVAMGKADLSIKSAIIDILLFIPGVTASLVTFLVFGTAKSWRQYRDLYMGGCGIRNKIIQRRFIRQEEREDLGPPSRGDDDGKGGVEFAPLPRIQNTKSELEAKRQAEALKRVQMFSAKEIGVSNSVVTTITAGEDLRIATAAWDDASRIGRLSRLENHGNFDNDSSASTLVGGAAEQEEIVHADAASRADGTSRNGERATVMQFHRPRPSVAP